MPVDPTAHSRRAAQLGINAEVRNLGVCARQVAFIEMNGLAFLFMGFRGLNTSGETDEQRAGNYSAGGERVK